MTQHALRIHVLNQGHGDSIVLETDSTDDSPRFALVDCHWSAPTLAYLHRLGCRRLEFVVATHAHSDHILGLPAVLSRSSGIEVHELIVTHTDHPSRTWRRVLECAHETQTRMSKAGQGGEVQFGACHVLVLGPSPGLTRLRALVPGERLSENERSIVLRVTLGTSRAVLGGDAQEHCWTSVFDSFPDAELRSQVLKIAHHGSKNGSPMGTLSIIRPSYSVISAGSPGQGYCLPDNSTLEALRERVAPERMFCTADSLPEERLLASIALSTTGDGRWAAALHDQEHLPLPLSLQR